MGIPITDEDKRYTKSKAGQQDLNEQGRREPTHIHSHIGVAPLLGPSVATDKFLEGVFQGAKGDPFNYQ